MISSPESLENLRKTFPLIHANTTFLLEKCITAKDTFQHSDEATQAYEMFALATHPDYRKRGIGLELVNQAFKVFIPP